ncbi:MAG: hypothetical protein BGO49_27445 [Planctomycetales bacterium 71-10]|nr:MAG: hypothetical protein BGO49_27445 [Planctomycetales bacterium 71-10]
MQAFGELDVVFANAGRAAMASTGRTNLAELEDVVRINLTVTTIPLATSLRTSIDKEFAIQ